MCLYVFSHMWFLTFAWDLLFNYTTCRKYTNQQWIFTKWTHTDNQHPEEDNIYFYQLTKMRTTLAQCLESWALESTLPGVCFPSSVTQLFKLYVFLYWKGYKNYKNCVCVYTCSRVPCNWYSVAAYVEEERLLRICYGVCWLNGGKRQLLLSTLYMLVNFECFIFIDSEILRCIILIVV